MRRLFVYRLRNHWFGQLTESKETDDGDCREIRNIPIPQSVAEIERFATACGYTVEWDAGTRTDPAPSRHPHDSESIRT